MRENTANIALARDNYRRLITEGGFPRKTGKTRAKTGNLVYGGGARVVSLFLPTRHVDTAVLFASTDLAVARGVVIVHGRVYRR